MLPVMLNVQDDENSTAPAGSDHLVGGHTASSITLPHSLVDTVITELIPAPPTITMSPHFEAGSASRESSPRDAASMALTRARAATDQHEGPVDLRMNVVTESAQATEQPVRVSLTAVASGLDHAQAEASLQDNGTAQRPEQQVA